MRFVPGWAVPTSWPILMFVSIFIGVFSLIKGWLSLIVLPLLLLVLPILFVTRYMVRGLLARGGVHPWIAMHVRLQLIGIMLFYFFLPAAGDGSPTLVWMIDSPPDNPMIPLFGTLFVVGMAVFLWSSAAIFASFLKPKIPVLSRWFKDEVWLRIDRGGKNRRD